MFFEEKAKRKREKGERERTLLIYLANEQTNKCTHLNSIGSYPVGLGLIGKEGCDRVRSFLGVY